MFSKNIIAPISGKYPHQSKQNIEQATMAILGVSVIQTKPAPLFTEASVMNTGYFLLRYSVNLINPKCFSAKIQHSKAALVSEIRHTESRLHITCPSVFLQNTYNAFTRRLGSIIVNTSL